MNSASVISSDEHRWNTLLQRRLETEIVRAYRHLRSNDIEPLLIKGWAAARNYPKNVLRNFSDIDIAVSHGDFDRARSLFKEGYKTSIGFDIHDELRHLDLLPWTEISERSELVELDGCPIRVPCAEDHLRIMAVHWLTDGGVNKERLLDIKYAVENRQPGFNWDECINPVGPIRRKWVLNVIGLAHIYSGLKIHDLPFAEEALDIPRWLMRALEREWTSGVRLRALNSNFETKREFFQQILKRIPPNAIQATVDMEGKFDDRSRIPYQIGSTVKRIPPSIRRLLSSKFRIKQLN